MPKHYNVIDQPVTDDELDDFWGHSVTPAEWSSARITATESFDCGDLADCAIVHFNDITHALDRNDPLMVGLIFRTYRDELITRRTHALTTGKQAPRQTGLIWPP